MAKLQQSLLPFTSESSSEELPKLSDPSDVRDAIPSKPPPQLPTELWDRILDLLEIFAPKSFRLVCLQWSVLGAKRLYSTVYLNPYESSWSGLISISTSRHASLVKKIVWNPLELPEECLDGEIWASRYQNLLRGLKNRQILQLHQAYAEAYKNRKSLCRSSEIESISGAMNNLRNCHEIILSDDYDLETNCKNSYFRVEMQSRLDLLKKPTKWGLHPRMWDRTEEGRDSLLAVGDVFRVLRGCHFITCLKIDFWATHWNEVHEAFKYEYIGNSCLRRSIRATTGYPHISKLEFRVRFCELGWLWVEAPSIQSTLKHAIGCTDLFPELQELSFIHASFSEPEHEFMEYLALESESIDDDDITLGPLVPAITASQLVTDHAMMQGLTDTILNCMYAELPITASPRPNLRTLRFSNATLDMRLILYWLASHKHLPSSSISLHLLETTVLYGLDPGLFLEALAQLNVRISYDRHNTFHYPLGSTFPRYIKTPHLECYVINGRNATFDRHWSTNALYLPDVGCILEPFPQFHEAAKQPCAEFIHRPDEFQQFVIDYAKNEYLTRQTIFYSYCLSLHEHKNSTWEWVRLTTEVNGPTDSEEQKRTAALVTLKLIAGDPG